MGRIEIKEGQVYRQRSNPSCTLVVAEFPMRINPLRFVQIVNGRPDWGYVSVFEKNIESGVWVLLTPLEQELY
jgi:hypothetical protein